MEQKWHDLLFMHWPLSVAVLRPLIPASLEIDTHDGTAWIGVVPFRMSGIRVRRLPPIPAASAFPELNVRTYVRTEGKPGVWFFSLDAAHALAVAAARASFHLPYFRAEMGCERNARGEVAYRSHRTHRHAAPADFRAQYAPSGDALRAEHGTLEYFLCERYCLYAADGERLFRGEIDHAPWDLRPARAKVETNTMADASGVALPNAQPLLHFAEFQHVMIWGLKEVRP
jgi:uncharacterized protein YqjF (DUF2071 family)